MFSWLIGWSVVQVMRLSLGAAGVVVAAGNVDRWSHQNAMLPCADQCCLLWHWPLYQSPLPTRHNNPSLDPSCALEWSIYIDEVD